jgi:hypothetical protein
VGKLAKMWGWHVDTVRVWFMDQPGCLLQSRPETMHGRKYTSIGVPLSVAERVYRRHCSK